MDALHFDFRLADFDIGLLPIDSSLLKGNADLLRGAVEAYLGDQFKQTGGEATITIVGDTVGVTWTPVSSSDMEGIKGHALSLLRDGALTQAQPIIETLIRRNPSDSDLLLNYAMLLTDHGNPQDAARLLEGLTAKEPNNASAWNALGVALWRLDRIDNARDALGRAFAINPKDAHVLKNLGALLAKESPTDALPMLKEAALLLPDDQNALYNLGLALRQTGDFDGSFDALQQAVGAAPYSSLAERCRDLLSQMSLEKVRGDAPAGLKMDAVMYCLAALKGFGGMDDARRKSVTAEIALLGRNGFDIASPEKKYGLKTMPGRFSGLELLSWMYVGLKELAPDTDPSIDLQREYDMAMGIYRGGRA